MAKYIFESLNLIFSIFENVLFQIGFNIAMTEFFSLNKFSNFEKCMLFP